MQPYSRATHLSDEAARAALTPTVSSLLAWHQNPLCSNSFTHLLTKLCMFDTPQADKLKQELQSQFQFQSLRIDGPSRTQELPTPDKKTPPNTAS
jgi:hypothetical protein